MANLCAQCDNITLTYTAHKREADVIIRTYSSLAELKSAALGLCAFCRLIWHVGLKESSFEETSTVTLCRFTKSNAIEVQYKRIDGASHSWIGGGLNGLYAEPDDPAAQWILNRPIDPNPNSDAIRRLVLQWRSECQLTHSNCTSCTSRKAVPLPTRILDVGLPDGSQEPYLYVPVATTRDEYAALSYCWGDVNADFVLRKENFTQKQDQVSLSTLPKTLQDAISITRSLELRYLWIDALCIIQNSMDDWKQESAAMEDVYSNASITIAASGAADSGQGIFIPRQASDVPTPKLKFLGPDASRGKVYLRYSSGNTYNPLSSRGWTLQEHLLSLCVLSYNRQFLAWECESIQCSEAVAPVRDLPWSWLRISKNPLIQTPLHDDVPSAADDSWQSSVFFHWLDIIEDYTSRNLRYPSDTLPALSGLASRAQKSLGGDEYLAGLWKSHMPYALLWTVQGENLKRRPSGNNAPSWSWASVIGPVSCGNPYRLPREDTFAEVLNFWIVHLGLNSFGAVNGGKMEIRGLLKQAGRLIPSNDQYGPNRLYIDYKDKDLLPPGTPRLNSYPGVCKFDDYDETTQIIDSVLWFFKITKKNGLILHASDEEKGIYRRVGCYNYFPYYEDLPWFTGYEAKSIFIV